MTYTTPEIERIWSVKNRDELWTYLWKTHEGQCPKTTDTLSEDERGKIRVSMEESGHEVVRGLYERILDGRLGANAHLGLTSSDIADNARALQCNSSEFRIAQEMGELVGVLRTLDDLHGTKSAVAYTHLIPAKGVLWNDVFETWGLLIKGFRAGGTASIPLRGFRGSVGLSHTGNGGMKQIMKKATRGLGRQTEITILLQNWSPLSALRVTSWIAGCAVVMNKINQDCRHYVVRGDMKRYERDATASSTLSHKHSNPAVFERHVALCRLVISDVHAMHETLLDQALQRTLDDSAVYREVLPRVYGYLAYVVEETARELGLYNFEDVPYDTRGEEETITRVLTSNGSVSRTRADMEARNVL